MKTGELVMAVASFHDKIIWSGARTAGCCSNNAFYVRRITTPLNMTTLGQFNWFNQPAVTTTNQVLVPHTNLRVKDVAVDVTAIVKQVVADGPLLGPLGLMIQLQSETHNYNIRIFSGSTNIAVDRRPKLLIEYN